MYVDDQEASGEIKMACFEAVANYLSLVDPGILSKAGIGSNIVSRAQRYRNERQDHIVAAFGIAVLLQTSKLSKADQLEIAHALVCAGSYCVDDQPPLADDLLRRLYSPNSALNVMSEAMKKGSKSNKGFTPNMDPVSELAAPWAIARMMPTYYSIELIKIMNKQPQTPSSGGGGSDPAQVGNTQGGNDPDV